MVNNVENFLNNLVKSLDISETLYDNAVTSYESLGKWLNRDDSSIKKYGASVYAQGSFALGTVIKPITDEDDYDIDLVCQVDNLNRQKVTQAELKNLVGKEVKRYHQAHHFNEEIHEGKRCWTLNYSEEAKFHLDILPSIDEDLTQGTSIYITDNTSSMFYKISNDWKESNPKAYQAWFKQKNTLFEKKRKILAESNQVSIDKVPEYRVKTPLQRAIQIAKRYRDIMFNGKSQKPISIIITTLFAMAYHGEETISDIFTYVVPNLIKQFEKTSDGCLLLRNPVNPNEFFTDRWKGSDEIDFVRWLSNFTKLVNSVPSLILTRNYRALYESFGNKATKIALGECGLNNPKPSTIKIIEPMRPWRIK